MPFFPEPIKLDALPAGNASSSTSRDGAFASSSSTLPSNKARTQSVTPVRAKKDVKGKGKAVSHSTGQRKQQQLDQSLLDSRVNSTLRLRSAWQDIATRYSTPLASSSQILPIGRMRALREQDDDVIDLESMSIVQDRGIIRNAKPGSFAIGSWWSASTAGTSDRPSPKKKRRLAQSKSMRDVHYSDSDDEHIGGSAVRRSKSDSFHHHRRRPSTATSDTDNSDDELPWEVASDPEDVLGSWIDLPSAASLRHSDHVQKRKDERSELLRFRQAELQLRGPSETPFADDSSASESESEAGTTFLPEPSAALESDQDDELAIEPVKTPKAVPPRPSPPKPSSLRRSIWPSPSPSIEPEPVPLPPPPLVMRLPDLSSSPFPETRGPFSAPPPSRRSVSPVRPAPSAASIVSNQPPPPRTTGLQTPPNSKEVDVEVFKMPFLPASATRRLASSSSSSRSIANSVEKAVTPRSTVTRPVEPPSASSPRSQSIKPASTSATTTTTTSRMNTRSSSVSPLSRSMPRSVRSSTRLPSLSPAPTSSRPLRTTRAASTAPALRAAASTGIATGDKRHRTSNEILPVPLSSPAAPTNIRARSRSMSVSPWLRQLRSETPRRSLPLSGPVASTSAIPMAACTPSASTERAMQLEDEEDDEDELLMMETPSPAAPPSSTDTPSSPTAASDSMRRRRMMSVTPSPSERMKALNLNLNLSSSARPVSRSSSIFHAPSTGSMDRSRTRSVSVVPHPSSPLSADRARQRMSSIAPVSHGLDGHEDRTWVLRETPRRSLPPDADELGI